MVRIIEAYINYKPRANVAKVIRKLLARAPERYSLGLDCVVLTNLSGQPRRKRLGKTTSRGRRVPQSRMAGLYHQKWKGEPPWIELYIDQILQRWPRYVLWVPLFRDLAIADVFYHELGHHVHLVIRPEYREREDVADDWGKKFTGKFLWEEYWYLVPAFRVLRALNWKKRPHKRG